MKKSFLILLGLYFINFSLFSEKYYQDVISKNGADTKAALYEQKRKDDERKAHLSDRKTFERMQTDIRVGRHKDWPQQDKDDWLIVNKLFNSAPNVAQQKQADSLSSQMPLVPTTEKVAQETGKTKIGEVMKQSVDQQTINAASADFAFASPEVRFNVENETEAGKVLIMANATDIINSSGFKEANKTLKD